MSDTTRLIKAYYRTIKEKKYNQAVMQLDAIAEMVAELTYADYCGLFYKRDNQPSFIPLAYFNMPGKTVIESEQLELHWKTSTANHFPAGGEFRPVKESQSNSPSLEKFTQANNFSFQYTFPFTTGESKAVIELFWREQPHFQRKRIENILRNLMVVVEQLMAGMTLNHRINDFSIRLSDFISLFELPIDTYDLETLTEKMIDRLTEVINGVAYSLFSFDKDAGQYVPVKHWGGHRPQLPFLNQVCRELGAMQQELDIESLRPGSWIDFTTQVDHEFASVILAPLAFDDESKLFLMAYTHDIGCLSQNDKELLSVFSLFSGVILRDAGHVKNLDNANRLLKTASEKIVNNETLAALTNMTSGLAHEFNNMIGGIIGRVQIMKLTSQDEKLTKGLDIIEKLATDGATTLKRIQEFSTGTKYKQLEAMDCREKFEWYYTQSDLPWQTQATNKQLTVKTELADDNLWVEANIEDLKIAMDQLMLNAVEYADEGSIIYARLYEESDTVIMDVTNTGPTIPKEHHTKIFNPFFSTQKRSGAGMGLAIVHGIITRHNADISFTSENNQTTFRLSLSRTENSPAKKERSGKRTAPESLNILVVDDDEQIREVLTDMLTIDGYNITACPDGESAYEEFSNNNYDLLITDLGMPGMSGLDLAGMVHEKNPEVPIAMITGWGTQLNEDEIAHKGIKSLMSKPFHLKDIKLMIHELTETS